jgi:diacylglycerol kinase family enzyme
VASYAAENRRKPAIRLELPDGELIPDLYMTVVTNCTPWTFLGNHPMSPTPQASFDAGLDVYARTRMGLPSIAWGAARIARGTTKSREYGARIEHDLTDFVLRAARPMPFQVDGDSLGEREVVRFSGVRSALSVLV